MNLPNMVTSKLEQNGLQRQKEIIVLLICFCLVLILQRIWGEITNTNLSTILKYEIVLVVALFPMSFFYLRYRIYEPIFLWFFFITLFMFGRVFLDLLEIDEFGRIRNFVVYHVRDETEQRALENLLIAAISFYLGWLLHGLLAKSWIKASGSTEMKPIGSLQKVGFAGLVALFPIVLGYYYEIFMFVKSNGYLAYQLGKAPPKGLFVYFSEQLSWFFLALFLAGLPRKKVFVTVAIFVILPLLMTRMLSGSRGFSMTMIVSLFWYWHYFYQPRVRIWIIIPMVTIIMFGLSYVGAYRSGEFYSISRLIDLLVFFADGQGASVTTLLVSVEHGGESPLSSYGIKNVFAELFMQLDKLLMRLFGGETVTLGEALDNFGYSGYAVTEVLNNKLLSTGASLGTSYLTELYLVGREWAQFLGGALFGAIFHYLYRMIYVSRTYFVLFLVLLPQLLYLPRMSLFSPISLNIVALVAISIFVFLSWRLAGTRDLRD